MTHTKHTGIIYTKELKKNGRFINTNNRICRTRKKNRKARNKRRTKPRRINRTITPKRKHTSKATIKINKYIKGVVEIMKKQFNITLEESTIAEIKEEAEKLEISASALMTILFKQYQKEQIAMNLIKNKDVMQALEQISKEMNKI